MSGPTTHEQRRVHFSGQVQGVGFRYTAHALARRFDVVGYVQNLPDGRVLLVAEGPPDEVQRFVEVLEAHMKSYIAEAEAQRGPATGEFQEFGINL